MTYTHGRTALEQRGGERELALEQEGLLCEDVCRGGHGHKLAQDILGHLDVVLRDHQSFLDVLVGVTLAHEQLDLAADLRVAGCSCGGNRARPAVRVDAAWEGLRRPFGSFYGLER